jgi:arsenite oxidase small subunit
MKAVVIPALPGSAQTTSVAFPKVKVANVGDLTTGSVVSFNYPLDNEPNLLVKLGTVASGGVGPDGDIVAFSQVCQHLGCVSVNYVQSGGSPSCNKSFAAPGPVGYCCCHASVFDFANGGKVIGGPSPRPLPQVILEVDASGDIYATGMGPPSVFGHNTGSNNVNDDLVGGNLVS